MFNNGFSALLPVTIKDQLDINDFSTVYSDYFMNLCDKTTLLLEGVVPMTEDIPINGFTYTSQQIEKQLPYLAALLISELLIMIALPIIYQSRNYGKIKKIKV